MLYCYERQRGLSFVVDSLFIFNHKILTNSTARAKSIALTMLLSDKYGFSNLLYI